MDKSEGSRERRRESVARTGEDLDRRDSGCDTPLAGWRPGPSYWSLMAGSNPALPHQDVRYQPDERPPLPMTAGLGMQSALICIASIILTPTVMITVAGGSEDYLSWAVFAALVVSGLTTAIQARRVGHR